MLHTSFNYLKWIFLENNYVDEVYKGWSNW